MKLFLASFKFEHFFPWKWKYCSICICIDSMTITNRRCIWYQNIRNTFFWSLVLNDWFVRLTLYLIFKLFGKIDLKNKLDCVNTIAWHKGFSRSHLLIFIIIIFINLFVLLALQVVHNMSDKTCFCMGVWYGLQSSASQHVHVIYEIKLHSKLPLSLC